MGFFRWVFLGGFFNANPDRLPAHPPKGRPSFLTKKDSLPTDMQDYLLTKEGRDATNEGLPRRFTEGLPVHSPEELPDPDLTDSLPVPTKDGLPSYLKDSLPTNLKPSCPLT